MATSSYSPVTNTSVQTGGGNERHGLTRQCVDAIVLLALAVILFRGFAVEGYMISTGSMAPCLLGYHRQIVCPACSFAFSRGTRFDDDQAILAAGPGTSDFVGDTSGPSVLCPNCGLETIDASHVPRNEGDQLLVHKHLYQLRSPRRWEVVVFRHPDDADQAYVKRVVGLPDETVAVRDGDVYVDGTLQRKSLTTQRSMRIVVYDRDHVPVDAQWQPRWRLNNRGPWEVWGDGFVHRQRERRSTDPDDCDWLVYHHWVRSGGGHGTSVDLTTWPDTAPAPLSLDRRLRYDPVNRQLTCTGVLPDDVFARLRGASRDPEWVTAIDALQKHSHESPVIDQYGYNHPATADPACRVHDLMVEAVIRRTQGAGCWRLQMTDGHHDFEAVFDTESRTVSLFVDGADHPIRTGLLPAGTLTHETTVEMSLFDRQVLLAVDGELILEPLTYAFENRSRQLTSTPIRIGTADLDLQISHLRIYRDVHYTPKGLPDRQDAVTLGPDEFYMLGDNSPVSVDSRSWDSPAVPRRLLIGKPLLVHLPSRQGRVEIAGRVQHIRIPDFTQVRYIR